MVESESFIKEVSEEVKRDNLFKILNKFKWPLFALIIFLIGAVGGFEYYKFSKKAKAQKNGEFLVSAIKNLKSNDQTVTDEVDNKFISVFIKWDPTIIFMSKKAKSIIKPTIKNT